MRYTDTLLYSPACRTEHPNNKIWFSPIPLIALLWQQSGKDRGMIRFMYGNDECKRHTTSPSTFLMWRGWLIGFFAFGTLATASAAPSTRQHATTTLPPISAWRRRTAPILVLQHRPWLNIHKPKLIISPISLQHRSVWHSLRHCTGIPTSAFPTCKMGLTYDNLK